jgi:hypothetical protein
MQALVTDVSFVSLAVTLSYDYTCTLDVTVDMSWAAAFGANITTLNVLVNGEWASGAVQAPGVYRVTFTSVHLDIVKFNDAYIGLSPTDAVTTFLGGVDHYQASFNDSGRYAVPFHHGSHVRVDDAPQSFEVDYIVDSSRGFIQFLAGSHPTVGQHVDINYFNSDRVLLSINDPFDFGDAGYDVLPVDTTLYDLPDSDEDFFLLTVDSLAAKGYDLVFTNTVIGTTKADIEEVLIYPSEVDGNVWTLTAVGFQTLQVQQTAPTVGPIEYAYLNRRFDNAKIAFTLKNTWLDYYFVQDANSYIAYDVTLYDLEPHGEPLDAADFWPSLDIKTEHGVVDDPVPPLHAPVELVEDIDLGASIVTRRIGIIEQVAVATLVGSATKYQFVLDDVPRRGTYIEVRVEQARQHNPRANVSIVDQFTMIELP